MSPDFQKKGWLCFYSMNFVSVLCKYGIFLIKFGILRHMSIILLYFKVTIHLQRFFMACNLSDNVVK